MVDFLDHTTTASFRTGARPILPRGSDAGQRALIAVPLDALELALEAPQAGRRVVVLVPRVGQMTAHHAQGLPELVQTPAQPSQATLPLLRCAVDPDAPAAH